MSDTQIKNGSRAAFPLHVKSDECGDHWTAGLTKREYLAGLALQGILCNGWVPFGCSQYPPEAAVEMADALLAELEKGQS